MAPTPSRYRRRSFGWHSDSGLVALTQSARVAWAGADLRQKFGGVGYIADNQRAAASALSSGSVLNAVAALGAALCTVLTMVSNKKRFLGGRRTPPPMTTQSYVVSPSRRSTVGPAVASGWIRQTSACHPRSVICFKPCSIPA